MPEGSTINARLVELFGEVQSQDGIRKQGRRPAGRTLAIQIESVASLSITIHEHHHHGSNSTVPAEAHASDGEEG